MGEKDLEAYEGLTHRGKMRRMRRVAREAIDAFGFTGAKLRLIADAGNITYRVKAGDQPGVETENDIYEDNCYLLRLHQPGYQTSGNIASELQWLSALCDENLPAPMPILAVDREMSVEVSVPGVPGVRRCSLLRWVKGRMATKLVRPGHMKAIGRLIARLHIHASSWRPASGFVRRHYDRNGLWVDDTGTNYTASEVWAKIPRRFFEDFQEVTVRVERVMEDWGKGLDVYGLIHADLGTKANVLFHGGEARAIDFDDGGFGYWMYDLAMPLADWEGETVWPAYRDAMLEGYTEMRSMPEEQLDQLELFQAAIRAMEVFWGTAGTMRRPDSTYWNDRRARAWGHIRRYLEKKPANQ